MAEKKANDKLKLILLDLTSADQKKVAKAIKSLHSKGDSTAIKPLADCLMRDISPKNKAAILELFSSLKDTSARVEIMDVIGDEKYRMIRQEVLTTIWNTKIDFSDYIDEFVEIACKGSLMETLDCLTIIENLEGPFIEENILESQLHLRDYMEGDEQDDQKAEFLSEIALILKDINEKLMD